MTLANISVPLTGLIDSAILGHLDRSDYLGAAAIGTHLLGLMYWAFSFLRMGTTSETGQALGANNLDQLMISMKSHIIVALFLGLTLIAIHPLVIPYGVGLIADDISTIELANQYLEIRITSAPAVLLTYVFTGWLIGLQKTHLALAIMLCVNLTNVVGDYWLIVGLNLNVKGAALACVFAEYLGLTIAFLLCYRQVRGKYDHTVPIQWSLTKIKELFNVNSHLFIRTLGLLLVFNFFTAQGTQFGINTLAANALLLQLVLFVSFAVDGYAQAAETMVAHDLGAKDRSQFMNSCAVNGFTSLIIAIFLSLCLWIFGSEIISLLTNLPEVENVANVYFIWVILLPVISVWGYLFDGIFIGAGEFRQLRNGMLVSIFLVFLPAWWCFQDWQNDGLWFALLLFNASRGLTLFAYFIINNKRNNWKALNN